jgi:hypothetical protein
MGHPGTSGDPNTPNTATRLQIELATLRMLNGSLPPRALRLVRVWARLHTEELADNWVRAQALEPLASIEPLP